MQCVNRGPKQAFWTVVVGQRTGRECLQEPSASCQAASSGQGKDSAWRGLAARGEKLEAGELVDRTDAAGEPELGKLANAKPVCKAALGVRPE